MSRKAYPSDVRVTKNGSSSPRTCPCGARDATQRIYPLRELFDAVRWMVKAGCPWRLLPNDLPPWTAVHQQAERWRKAGCFEAVVHDLRELLRLLQERHPRPTAEIFDGRTLQSSPESGGRAGGDGYKRRKGQQGPRRGGHALGICSPCWSPQPASRNVPRLENWPDRCRPPRNAASNSASVIRATRAINLLRQRRPQAPSWRSSNWRKPNVASCSCPGVGWSNAPLLGWRVCDDFPATTNGCRAPWLGCTGSPLRACYSATCSRR